LKKYLASSLQWKNEFCESRVSSATKQGSICIKSQLAISEGFGNQFEGFPLARHGMIGYKGISEKPELK
jgi:hypothetical protein